MSLSKTRSGGTGRNRSRRFGRREALVDANSHRTTFAFDAVGNVTKETNPLNLVTTYSYTQRNQQESKLDARGVICTYSYDAVGRLTGQHFTDNSRFTFTYDGNGNRLLMGDKSGLTTYTYDERDQTTYVIDGANKSITYSYDSVGNRFDMRTNNVLPAKYSYTYDALNRCSVVTDNTRSPVRVTTDTYDAAGRESTRSHSVGATSVYGYDAAGRTTSIEHWKTMPTVLSLSKTRSG